MRTSLALAGAAVMALSGCDPTYTETLIIDGERVSIYANHFLVTSYYVRWGDEYIYCGSTAKDCIETLKLLETGEYDRKPGNIREGGGDGPEPGADG